MDARAVPNANYVLQACDFFGTLGDAEAIVAGDRRFSYGQTRSAIFDMAAVLSEHGVRSGMSVITVVKNHPESIFLQLALHLLGCRTGFIPLYAPHRDQVDFIEHAGMDVFVHDSDLAEGLIKELSGRAKPVPVLSLGPAGAGPDLLAELTGDAPRFDPSSVGGEPESLFYTSGTTGQPKLVLHRQRFYQALFVGGQYYRASGEPAMRHLGIPAFSTTSGQMPGLLALFQGGAAILMHDLDMPEFLATIERERVTSTFIGPLRLYEMLDHPALAQTDYSSLRYLNCGASAPTPARLAQAIERLGPVVRLVYGMTEAPLITDLPFLDFDPEHPGRLSSCGKPFADMRIEIRDEKGAAVGTGETGAVWVSGMLVMDEYWGQPELTAQTLVDGWLHTGDVGYLDEEGFLYLVDRSKDIIITGKSDQKVYSRVVEDILATHPDVRAAAVIGVPDEELGEAVHAFVVIRPGASVTEAELRNLVATGLKELYAPRHVEFVDSLPLTGADKVNKLALRARYRAGPNA